MRAVRDMICMHSRHDLYAEATMTGTLGSTRETVSAGSLGVRRAQFGAAEVLIAESNAAAGSLTAALAAERLIERTSGGRTTSVILATGNSQITFLEALTRRPDVPWARISIFHMDEYVGLPASHPASFRRFLTDHLVASVQPRAFHGIDGNATSLATEQRCAVTMRCWRQIRRASA